jgi:type IV pilus assembly protein PilB
MDPLDIRFHNSLVSRIKVMSELDIAERRIPQDGRFKLRIEKRTVDFRVSIIPSAFGESVVIRILAREEFKSSQKGLHLDSLGLKQEDLAKFRRAITASYGMVLVTGPTGSGKTTTLYAALNEVNTKEDKVITIEDPVEYQLRGVVQIPVNEKKGLTFARGLRSILRHDPDKIMVGEIRDAETGQIAIQSALTGHLVFSTVHANNAFDVIGRFVNMGIEPYLFVSSLHCIMAQRLIRTLCPSCKTPVRVDPDESARLGYEPELFAGRVIYDAKGCVDCHQLGYRGRMAITEFLSVTEAIKDLILERRPPSELRRAAEANGMSTLRQAGIEKIFAGETTMKEVNRMTFIG